MTKDILTALLVNTAVFSALFALMLPVRRLLAKRISAALQYALWAVVVIKLVIPFGLESSLSPFGLLASGSDADISAISVAVNTPTEEDNAGLQTESQTGGRVNTNASAGLPKQQTTQRVLPSVSTASPTAAPAAAMDWTAMVLALWAAGALAAASMMGLHVVRLRRRIYRFGTSPSSRIMSIYEHSRQELGVSRKVRLMVQPVLRAPAVMGILKPLLVLPEDIEAHDDEQIRHICLHELSHLKRGDLAVILLLNALSAVYWFNPCVWLCFGFIRRDMESACDQRVLEKLGTQARQYYIGTVLRFAQNPDEHRLMAAMGMADGRLTMEQRIRGMFRQTRTGLKTRVAAVCIALLMLAVSMLTACQPTPETPPVVNKGDNHLEDMIASSAASAPASSSPAASGTQSAEQEEALKAALRETLGAPETFNDSYTSEKGDVAVVIDAEVDVPAVQNIPAVAVTLGGFSQEKVDRFAEYFLKGEPVFTEEKVQTKDEIMSMIVMRQQDIENAKKYAPDNADSLISDAEKRIEELQKEYEAAPEERARTASTTALIPSDNGSDLYVVADLGKDEAARFIVGNYSEHSDFSFVNDGKGNYYPMSYGWETLDGIRARYDNGAWRCGKAGDAVPVGSGHQRYADRGCKGRVIQS